MIKHIGVLTAALALGVGVAYGAAPSPADTCIPHQGNHCKRLADQGTTTDGSSTTTAATTTAATTTAATTTTGTRKGGSTSTTITSTTPTTTTTSGSSGVTTGSVQLEDKTWTCPGAVNMQSVSVTISATSLATDAVKLANGCTGYIGHIDVVQWKGDGIHIANAHDLVIGSVTIRCYAHVPLKHQDGIQVLGGQNVTINNADVGCYSANNSQVWINDGSGSGPGGTPTNIVFQGGKFQGYFNNGQYGPGGAYGVAIVGSVQSGVRNATICPNAHPAHALYVATSAQAPVTSGTVLSHNC
jgi:hypothetical protein